MCELECQLCDKLAVASKGVDPSLVAVLAVFAYHFVQDVPGINLAVEMLAHGLYVAAHSLHQLVVALGGSVRIVPEEIRGLVVPYKGMCVNVHSVVASKLAVLVRRAEVPGIRPGVEDFRLEVVLRGD